MCVFVWQGNTGRNNIAWAEGNPPLGPCDWTLSCCSFSFDTQTDVRMCKENARHGNTGQKKIAWAEGNPLLGLCNWTLFWCTLSL